MTFADFMAWIAGVLGVLIAAAVTAAFTFAFLANQKLTVIVYTLKDIHSDIKDHEDRLRHLERYTPPRRKVTDS